MKIPDKIPESVSAPNALRNMKTTNAILDYLRSLKPMASNTETLEHTALGTRRGSAPAAAPSDEGGGVWR